MEKKRGRSSAAAALDSFQCGNSLGVLLTNYICHEFDLLLGSTEQIAFLNKHKKRSHEFITTP